MSTEIEEQSPTELNTKILLDSPIEKRKRSGTDAASERSTVLTPEGSFSKVGTSSPAKKLFLKDDENSDSEEERLKAKRRHWEEEEARYLAIKKKVDEERTRLYEEIKQDGNTNKELYSIFNELQGVAQDFDIPIQTPEIVVTGMQSDGKSSFIEALVGFQFNIVDSNIGTRRPLIIQMLNNPERKRPLCRFRKEFLRSADEDAFEAEEIPAERLSAEILRRTNEEAGRGEQVSSKPIILRIEYCNCANLNIIDTPGFRVGGDQKLKDDILRLVKRLIHPEHRLIVCLEQSTVEWANTVSRPIIMQTDPEFQRTILINTKFDNRVKEFSNARAANKYMAGEYLTLKKKPFFISLPIRRGLDDEAFQNAIADAYLQDYRSVLEVGADEKYIEQLGFQRAKRTLEEQLHQRYLSCVKPTMNLLQTLVKDSEREIESIKKQLSECNAAELQQYVHPFVHQFMIVLEGVFSGSYIESPAVYGQTLKEEKDDCGGEWPDFDFGFKVMNGNAKMFGGAQFKRLLNEFEYVVHSREFPEQQTELVANAMGIAQSDSAIQSTSITLVRNAIFQILSPLIPLILARASHILKRAFTLVVAILCKEKRVECSKLASFDRFVDRVKGVFFKFIEETAAACKEKLEDEIETLVQVLDFEFISEVSAASKEEWKDAPQESSEGEDPKAAKKRRTKERVERIMNRRPLSFGTFGTEEDIVKIIDDISNKMFNGIRSLFARSVKNKMNAFFLAPIHTTLETALIDFFSKLTKEQYEEMFTTGIKGLRLKMAKLEIQHKKLLENYTKFTDTVSKLPQVK